MSSAARLLDIIEDKGGRKRAWEIGGRGLPRRGGLPPHGSSPTATPYDHIAQAIYRVFRLVRKAYRATQSHIEPREDFRARYIDYFFDGTLPVFFIVISTVIRDTQLKYNRSVIDFLR